MRQFQLAISLLLLFASQGIASPPDADWFPKATPLPKPTGQVIRVTTVDQLFQSVKDVQKGGTIVVADGHYRLPSFFAITTDDVTLRSESGDRHKVILDGANSRHGELMGVSGCKGVTLADLTIQNIKWNGIKIDSHADTHSVTIHNCVIHNIWQRGIKASAVPKEKQELSPRDCRIQFCLFYNDRPKQYSDDNTDTPKTYDGNYIGGIDVKNTINWRITDNVFIGIQGRTREGRGCIYISENGRGCVIERNIFLNSDIAIALGNPTLGYSPLQAIDCKARNNFIADCPETGILASYTRDCVIADNTIYDPQSARRRLIWAQKSNDGLKVTNNLLVSFPVLVTTQSRITNDGNIVAKSLTRAIEHASQGVGQKQLPTDAWKHVITLTSRRNESEKQSAELLFKPGLQSDACIKAMTELNKGFNGQAGYVAQFGDSITFSMAFCSVMEWSDPDSFLTLDDGLPKKPNQGRWRDWIKGARAKGGQHGNYSGWTVGQMLKAMDGVLTKEKPEVAIIMIGTNDISGGRVPQNYQKQLESAVQKCLDAKCIPILNTIPPRRGRDDAVSKTNQIIRDTSEKFNVPLADFYSECVRLCPDGSWDGTVISKDGVHPSGGKTNDYSEGNLKQSGYALRNWVNFLVLRQLHFRVLNSPNDK